jgi:hypothetical protein
MSTEYFNKLSIHGPESSVAAITDEFLNWLSQNCTATDTCYPDVERAPDMITAEWLSYGDHVDAKLLKKASRKLPYLQFHVEWLCGNYDIEGLVVVMHGRIWCHSQWPMPIFSLE